MRKKSRENKYTNNQGSGLLGITSQGGRMPLFCGLGSELLILDVSKRKSLGGWEASHLYWDSF